MNAPKKSKPTVPQPEIQFSSAKLNHESSSAFAWGRPGSWALILVLLLAGSMAWDRFNGGGVGCWPSKKIMVRLVGHFSGDNQKCGPFISTGVCYVKGGQIAVFDNSALRVLLFDLQGHFLNALSPKDYPNCQNQRILDPQNKRSYIADTEFSRIKVMDENGNLSKFIALKDRPWALTLDAAGRLFVGYGNYDFIQVFSAANGNFLGDLKVENPDPDSTYLDARALCVTEDGLLVAADRHSVWIYQLLKPGGNSSK
jgi:hypothetical protein